MNRYLFTLLFALSSLLGFAQQVGDFLYHIPEVHIPQVSPNAIKDVVDMKRANQYAQAPNLLGGKVVLDSLSEHYLKLQLSEVMTLEMTQLFVPKRGDKVDTLLCLVRTTCAGLCDSEISFYNTHWQQVTHKLDLEVPTVADFLAPAYRNPKGREQKDRIKQVVASIDLPLMSISLDLVNPITVRFQQDWMSVLPKELAAELEPYFVKEVIRKVEP